MVRIRGNFEGELKLDTMRFSKIITKTVMKNNDTSGKVLLPSEFISQDVVILLPKSERIRKRKGVRR